MFSKTQILPTLKNQDFQPDCSSDKEYNQQRSCTCLKDIEKLSRERLLRGLNNHEFKPYYQPQWNVRERYIDRAEVLVRWHYDTNVTLVPAFFLKKISDMSLMSTLGYDLFASVCKDLNTISVNNLSIKKIGINFSYNELVQPQFTNKLQAILNRYQIKASVFIIEITESNLFSNLPKLERVIQKLRILGFSFSLDDFCTGFSCFNHLNKLSVDALKLDRHFVDKIRPGNRFSRVCKGLVKISHNLGLEVTAEGVEKPQQEIVLEELGCNYLQGFLYGKAVPFAQLSQCLRSNISNVYKFPCVNRTIIKHQASCAY
ncbi:EAL domain-containing protein [Pseudomonadota bacterium]